jgi:hypothetical protein
MSAGSLGVEGVHHCARWNPGVSRRGTGIVSSKMSADPCYAAQISLAARSNSVLAVFCGGGCGYASRESRPAGCQAPTPVPGDAADPSGLPRGHWVSRPAAMIIVQDRVRLEVIIPYPVKCGVCPGGDLLLPASGALDAHHRVTVRRRRPRDELRCGTIGVGEGGSQHGGQAGANGPCLASLPESGACSFMRSAGRVFLQSTVGYLTN